MDLTALLMSQDDTNQVVEIYMCPDRVNETLNTINAGWKTVPNSFQKIAGNATSQTMNNQHPLKLYEYHHRDLCCSYDKTNDTQKIIKKTLMKEAYAGNFYGSCFIEEILPSHRFPCTQEITKEGNVERSSLRINNRMFICHDVEDDYHYIYIRYQHAANVDMKKMQEDLDKTLHKLTRSRP